MTMRGLRAEFQKRWFWRPAVFVVAILVVLRIVKTKRAAEWLVNNAMRLVLK